MWHLQTNAWDVAASMCLCVCVCVRQLSLMCVSVWALAALLSLTPHMYSLCWTLGLSLYISADLHPRLSDCRHECVCHCATWALVVYSPVCVWCCYSNTPRQSRLHGHSLAQHLSSLCPLHIFTPHLLYFTHLLILTNFKRSLLPRLVCWCHNGRWLFVWADSFDWQFVSAHLVHVLHPCRRDPLPASLAPQSPCWIDDGPNPAHCLSSNHNALSSSMSCSLILSVIPPSLMTHSEQMRASPSTPPSWCISLGRKERQSSRLMTSTGTGHVLYSVDSTA